MNHFRLVETADADGILEFSHFDYDAPAGLWKKEAVIIRDCIKLNVFAQGSFSVFRTAYCISTSMATFAS